MKRLHSLATGAFLLALAACTVQSQDILEDVTEGSSASSDVASSQSLERPFQDGLEIGRAGASVTMDLFLNYDSPYSRQFHALMPILETNFIEKGMLKVRIYPANFAKYPESVTKAAMLRCAAVQGKGAAMHKLLITGIDVIPPIVNHAAFGPCLAQPPPASTTAQEQGVTVVPTYVINNKTFTGVPTEADLLGAIRNAL